MRNLDSTPVIIDEVHQSLAPELQITSDSAAMSSNNRAQESKKQSSFGALYFKTTVALAAVITVGIWLPVWIFLDDPATGIGVGAMCAF